MPTRSAVAEFRLAASDFRRTGRGLSRPECVVAEPDGTLWTVDNRAILMRIDPDGRQELLGSMEPFPNGLAMERAGTLLVANIDKGQLFRVARDGGKTLLMDSFDGRPLGSLNFPYFDGEGTLWLSVSTRTVPRSAALAEAIPDGLLLRLDPDGRAELCGEGFCFTNELRIDHARGAIYIAETTLGRMSKAALGADGKVGPFAPFGPDPLYSDARVDGFALDSLGNLWVTELSRNAIVVLTPEGEAIPVFEDPDGNVLKSPTSIAFGGADLRTVYVGSLAMDHLPTFRSPVAGQPMHHWLPGVSA